MNRKVDRTLLNDQKRTSEYEQNLRRQILAEFSTRDAIRAERDKLLARVQELNNDLKNYSIDKIRERVGCNQTQINKFYYC